MLAALRNQFGGHAVERAAGLTDGRRDPRRDAENPLVEGLERLPVPPTTLVIFGATGDLARRKLLPALYNLAHEGALPERFKLIGVARREKADDDFREEARESISQFSRRDARRRRCSTGCSTHVQLRRRRTSTTPRATSALAQALEELDAEAGQPLNRDYYLSTAPEFFPVIIEQLKAAGPAPPRDGRRARDHREAVRHRPALGARAPGRSSRASSASARSSGSTTTWARRPSRT